MKRKHCYLDTQIDHGVENVLKNSLWHVGKYIVDVPTGTRRREAEAFCNKAYCRSGYLTQPSELFPECFYAFRNGQTGSLQGTIGIYLKKDTGMSPYPSEQAFNFSLATDLGMRPNEVGEVCRLSGRTAMFMPIIAWVTRHFVHDLGLRYALFGIKPSIKKVLMRMGLEPIIHDHIDLPTLASIPEEFHPYFTEGESPIVVTVDAVKVQLIIEEYLRKLKEEQ